MHPRGIAPEVNDKGTRHDEGDGRSTPGAKFNPAPDQLNPH